MHRTRSNSNSHHNTRPASLELEILSAGGHGAPGRTSKATPNGLNSSPEGSDASKSQLQATQSYTIGIGASLTLCSRSANHPAAITAQECSGGEGDVYRRRSTEATRPLAPEVRQTGHGAQFRGGGVVLG